MIRIVLENTFFFLLPTLVYIAYVAFVKSEWPGLSRVIRDAPIVTLFVLGATLMITTLVLFSSATGHQPGEAYVPPAYHDGTLVPGHANDQKRAP